MIGCRLIMISTISTNAMFSSQKRKQAFFFCFLIKVGHTYNYSAIYISRNQIAKTVNADATDGL
jgi:hypothetical protein